MRSSDSPCWFCPGVSANFRYVHRNDELCEACRANLRGFREYLRERCSSLEPLP